MNTNIKKHLSSSQIIIFGFAGAIILGTILLMLPISSASGNMTPLSDALFTSTSAVCVTGLVENLLSVTRLEDGISAHGGEIFCVQ